MKTLSLCLGLLALGLVRTGLAAESPASPAAAPVRAAAHASPPQVQVVTSLGSFTIELNEERAPLTVASFLKYVDDGQYTNTVFHRVIASFIIQGGGFDTSYKAKPAARKTSNESGNGLANVRGTVGLARTSEPHSGDCQFYVNLADNNALDPSPARWGYAVFGKVVQGMDVVDRIGAVSTGAHGDFKEDVPLQTITIQRIERVRQP
jgi:peptidyl-prolyl cis-trans isomerase A (cyclophilin A)/peptidyl-prolyl cis-trans isomerase B (cyclophilin B)